MLKQIVAYFSPEKKLYFSLKNILGFYPDNISLYLLAFRHRSAATEIKDGVKINSNERLEFLGDAVLGAVVAHYLFKKFPYKDEGFLTKMRSKIVSRSQLNQLAIKLGINKLIDSNTSGFQQASMSGDAFEALIGAIYIDKGYKKVSDFILNRIIKTHLDIDEIETKETDFKSKLIEWSQKEKKELKFILAEGTIENKQYVIQATIDNEIKGTATHFSKKRAEQLASEGACGELKI